MKCGVCAVARCCGPLLGGCCCCSSPSASHLVRRTIDAAYRILHALTQCLVRSSTQSCLLTLPTSKRGSQAKSSSCPGRGKGPHPRQPATLLRSCRPVQSHAHCCKIISCPMITRASPSRSVRLHGFCSPNQAAISVLRDLLPFCVPSILYPNVPRQLGTPTPLLVADCSEYGASGRFYLTTLDASGDPLRQQEPMELDIFQGSAAPSPIEQVSTDSDDGRQRRFSWTVPKANGRPIVGFVIRRLANATSQLEFDYNVSCAMASAPCASATSTQPVCYESLSCEPGTIANVTVGSALNPTDASYLTPTLAYQWKIIALNAKNSDCPTQAGPGAHRAQGQTTNERRASHLSLPLATARHVSPPLVSHYPSPPLATSGPSSPHLSCPKCLPTSPALVPCAFCQVTTAMATARVAGAPSSLRRKVPRRQIVLSCMRSPT